MPPEPVQPPMFGSWHVQVHAARPFTIHGDLYYEIMVTRLVDDDPTAGFTLRLPQHATAREPQPGQTLEITFLMGQITGAKPIG